MANISHYRVLDVTFSQDFLHHSQAFTLNAFTQHIYLKIQEKKKKKISVFNQKLHMNWCSSVHSTEGNSPHFYVTISLHLTVFAFQVSKHIIIILLLYLLHPSCLTIPKAS